MIGCPRMRYELNEHERSWGGDENVLKLPDGDNCITW